MNGVKCARENLCVALCGNPNVGKSTVFNALTGLRQHTGNWAGKTVETAQGTVQAQGVYWTLTDLPGTYSLLTGSPEEEVACDFLCLAKCDATIVVCDATCLERSLNLALQVIEASRRAVVCVNLMDEARRRGIYIDLQVLEERLGVPVVGCAARRGCGLEALKTRATELLLEGEAPKAAGKTPLVYPSVIEEGLALLTPVLARVLPEGASARFAALRVLAAQDGFLEEELLQASQADALALRLARKAALERLALAGLCPADVMTAMVTAGYGAAREVCGEAVKSAKNSKAEARQLALDRRLCSKRLGMPIMLLLLGLVFYITLAGANGPSAWLSETLLSLEPGLAEFLAWLGAPQWLQDVLAHGMYRVAAWVVAVMLPPMAIFFPLFTLLEDLGFLPRVAFNLDKGFQRCQACGKQALCMCMGF